MFTIPKQFQRPRPSARLAAALASEEANGVRLAYALRLVALVLISIFLTSVASWPQVTFYYGILFAFVVTGALSLIPDRKRRGGLAEWTRWLVPVLDLAIVAFALAHPNPFGSEPYLTVASRLRYDSVLYLVLVIALSTLTYSPRQVLWTGLLGVVIWTLATFWVAAQPGIHWVPLGAMQKPEDFSDAYAVVEVILIKQVFLLLVVTFLLAGAVYRSRGIALRQVRAEHERTQLGRYLSANLIDQLADVDRPLGEVRCQNVAVLFTDIVGFTGMSEREPPEQVIAMLREFHRRMQAAIFANHGTLDKYLGDGLMASFGTPHTSPRDAANALAAARAMAEALADWNRERLAAGEIPVQAGIGLHFGRVVLGDIGGENRLEFATIGDTVNVAARLQQVTRDLDSDIAVSIDLVEAIRRQVPQEEYEALLEGFCQTAPQTLRGRVTPLEVFGRPRAGLAAIEPARAARTAA